MSWKEVKARKDYQCLCCGGKIEKGVNHFVHTHWEGAYKYPGSSRYCSGCGPHIKDGSSFREARIKAFGSPFLRRWRRPK